MKLTLLQGDVFGQLPKIPDASIDLCLTSPPYWGMRDYGMEGQLGCEPTMEEYLDNTMKWVKEVWRVLKPTGSFVLNLGDCFIGGGRGNYGLGNSEISDGLKEKGGYSKAPNWAELKKNGNRDWKANSTPISVGGSGKGIYKNKQLLSVTSFAYCRIISETDFVCRGEHIWAKPNVPSPIRSRLKHSHEKLFWFVKDAENYYFDNRPWLKKLAASTPARMERATLSFRPQSGYDGGGHRMKPNKRAFADQLNISPTGIYAGGDWNKDEQDETIEHSWRIVPVGEKQQGFETMRNKPEHEHIAPFPSRLIEPYILSLTPPNGMVLDPFLGSGTTMRICMERNRDCVGIELNGSYADYIKARCNWGRGLDIEYCEK